MLSNHENQFLFGLEVEFALVDSHSCRPLWHQDLRFEKLNAILEAIPLEGVSPLDGLKVEAPHRKQMPFVVEGYHVPDPHFEPIDILPKGIEIRTPICCSIEQCVSSLEDLHGRLQSALTQVGYTCVTIGFHPVVDRFEGPQNKRRYDHWQWAMEAMVTYGPDLNVRLPSRVLRGLSVHGLHGKVNFYGPSITALTLSTPLCDGRLWTIRGRSGKSIRTYRRSVIAPAIEVHPDQGNRLEFKLFDPPLHLQDYHGLFLLWLELLLDESLHGRATKETRMYDLGAVARFGFDSETVRERANEILDRASVILPNWGFDVGALEPYKERLGKSRVPADEIIELWTL
jgi:carboxylate-amine ligase